MSITIISDTHGKYDQYYKIASKSEYSIQIGDFGFESAWNKLYYSDLDPNKHKVCGGNHEAYNIAKNVPHYLGDFGIIKLNNEEIFFIRGGISIDRVYRVGEELTGGSKTWWSEEELNFTQMLECLDLYKKIKPEIVISHVPPKRFIENIHGNKNNTILQKFKFHEGFCENTSLLCDEMLNEHLPSIWISGHHHRNYIETYGGRTGKMKFVSLAELSTYQLE